MDGPMLKAFQTTFLIVVVSTLALYVASCAPQRYEPQPDWGALANGVKKVQGR